MKRTVQKRAARAGFTLMEVLIAAVIALGLWRAEKFMIKAFAVFGKGIIIMITIGLAAAIVEALTGFVIIPGMESVDVGFQTVGEIAIVLAGAFPLVAVLTKLLKKTSRAMLSAPRTKPLLALSFSTASKRRCRTFLPPLKPVDKTA